MKPDLELEDFVTPYTLTQKQKEEDSNVYDLICKKILDFINSDVKYPNEPVSEKLTIKRAGELEHIKESTLRDVEEFYKRLKWKIKCVRTPSDVTVEIIPLDFAEEIDNNLKDTMKKQARAIMRSNVRGYLVKSLRVILPIGTLLSFILRAIQGCEACNGGNGMHMGSVCLLILAIGIPLSIVVWNINDK